MGMVSIFESQDQLEKRIRAIVTGRNVPKYAAILAIGLIGVVAVAALTGAERDKTPKATPETTMDPSISVDGGSVLSMNTISTAPPKFPMGRRRVQEQDCHGPELPGAYSCSRSRRRWRGAMDVIPQNRTRRL